MAPKDAGGERETVRDPDAHVDFPGHEPEKHASVAMREILLLNESGLNLPLTQEEIETLSHLVMEGESVPSYRIEIIYVDELEISRIHAEFLGDDEVTDNIAFSYGSEALLEGSIAQCAQRIIEQAGELDVKPRVEFARVLIHGLLHLAGHDDATDEMRADMSRDEDRYLSRAGYAMSD